jgi:RNA polymerase sigma-70 factor (ECF subfamily)
MVPPTDDTDERLLSRAAAGDEEAFVALYRRRQPAIYRYALQMGGSPAVAQDVTQEVFMAVVRGAAGFDATRGAVAPYLFGMARNLVRRAWRSSGPRATSLDAADAVEPSVVDDPLDGLVARERESQIQRAVAALPPHYREVIVLCELGELSYADTAAAIGQPVGTVRSRLHRARSLLANKLCRSDASASAIGEPSPRWSS